MWRALQTSPRLPSPLFPSPPHLMIGVITHERVGGTSPAPSPQ